MTWIEAVSYREKERSIPEKWKKNIDIYLAGLYNHKAHRGAITGHKKENRAAYAGFTIGELKKKGDWSLDTNYKFSKLRQSLTLMSPE